MTRRILLTAVLVGTVLAAMIQPAPAAQVAGVIVTGCTTRLFDFPNQAEQKNDDDCDSDTNGATVSGGPVDFAVGGIVVNGALFGAGGPDAARIAFSYNENCSGVPAGVFPPSGTARGNFIVKGTYNNAPAALVAGFTWSRSGLTAVIGFGPTIAGHNLDDGTLVGTGLFGLDTNGDYTNVEVSTTGVTAAALGLLQPRGGSGAHSLPYNNCPDDDGATQWEVVTAYAVGVLGSAS